MRLQSSNGRRNESEGAEKISVWRPWEKLSSSEDRRSDDADVGAQHTDQIDDQLWYVKQYKKQYSDAK